MAVIHRTELNPTKLELLTAWLPSRPWYISGTRGPQLAKAGGFRLDDPQGEVGIEFMIVRDTAGAEEATYLVPLTYRGAPLAGAEHALVGTMEHGVLGRRWAYDGCQDPVLITQLLALIDGLVTAQDQNASDTLDEEVTCGGAPGSTRVASPAVDDAAGTRLTATDGSVLRLHRRLRPTPADAPEAAALVAGAWHLPDGTRTRGPFATLSPGPQR